MQSQDRSGVAQDEPLAVTEDSIRRYLIEQVARRSQIATEEVDADRPLEEFGLASRDAVAIAGELEEMLGRSIPATLVWEYPTINRISAALTVGDVAAELPAPMAATTAEPPAAVGLRSRLPPRVTR